MRILISCLLLLVIVSCKKTNNTTSGSGKSYYLSKEVSGNYEVDFTWDNNMNLVQALSNKFKYTYVYTSNQLSQIKTFDSLGHLQALYTYKDSTGFKVVHVHNFGMLLYKTDSQSRTINRNTYGYDSVHNIYGGAIPGDKEVYEFDSKWNFINENDTLNTGKGKAIYDNNPTIFSHFPTYKGGPEPIPVSVNNPLQQAGSSFVYEYNSDGYPISYTETDVCSGCIPQTTVQKYDLTYITK